MSPPPAPQGLVATLASSTFLRNSSTFSHLEQMPLTGATPHISWLGGFCRFFRLSVFSGNSKVRRVCSAASHSCCVAPGRAWLSTCRCCRCGAKGGGAKRRGSVACRHVCFGCVWFSVYGTPFSTMNLLRCYSPVAAAHCSINLTSLIFRFVSSQRTNHSGRCCKQGNI